MNESSEFRRRNRMSSISVSQAVSSQENSNKCKHFLRFRVPREVFLCAAVFTICLLPYLIYKLSSFSNNRKEASLGRMISSHNTPIEDFLPYNSKFEGSSLHSNILLIYFKHHPAISIFSNHLANSFRLLYVPHIFSQRFYDVHHELRLSGEKDDEPHRLLPVQQLQLDNYVHASLSALLDKRNRLIEFEISDIWRNKESLTRFISSFQEYGKVSHIINLIGNPIRTELSKLNATILDTLKYQSECELQRGKFTIELDEIMDDILGMRLAFSEINKISSVKQIGISYETEVERDLNEVMINIQQFLGESPRSSETIHLPKVCPLSTTLRNFQEMKCLFEGSPVNWVLQSYEREEHKQILLNFEDSLSSIQLFSNWILGSEFQKRKKDCNLTFKYY